MRTKLSTTTAKVYFILRRYYIKSTGTVCADIRNECGVNYRTCLFRDGRASCSCPATSECYHIRHLRQAEAVCTHHTEQDILTSAQEDEHSNRARMSEKALVLQVTIKDSTPPRTEASSVNIAMQKRMEGAALNGNREFSILR